MYESDIQRLEAIDEAGFLLSLGGDRTCPMCGASPENQKFVHGIYEIERARSAAGAEIAKIRQRSTELETTLDDLDLEAREIEWHLDRAERQLSSLEEQLQQFCRRGGIETLKQFTVQHVRDAGVTGFAPLSLGI